MSATNHTANLNLPIYQPNDVLNYTLDWNGAMQTLDTSVTANKTLGDRLETDFENIQTDFETVSSKADSAATTAAAANSAATNAVTIANNASTMAGDAKTDAHAALEFMSKLTENVLFSSIVANTSNIPLYGYCHIYMRHTPIGTYYYGEVIIDANNSATKWPLVPGNNTARYCPTKMTVPSPYLHPFNSEGIYTIGNVGMLNAAWNESAGRIEHGNLNVAWWGIYQDANNNQYLAIQTSNNPSPAAPYWHYAVNFFHPNTDKIITPVRLSGLPTFMSLDEFSKYDLNEISPTTYKI